MFSFIDSKLDSLCMFCNGTENFWAQFVSRIKCLAHKVHGDYYFQSPHLESLLAARSQSSLSVLLGAGYAPNNSPMILTPKPVPYLNSVEDSGSPRCTSTSDNSNQASYSTSNARHTVYNSYPPTNFTSSTSRSRSLAPSVSQLLLSPRNSNGLLMDILPRTSKDKYKADFSDISYSRPVEQNPLQTPTRRQTKLIYSHYQRRKRLPRRKRIVHLIIKPKGASYVTHKH